MVAKHNNISVHNALSYQTCFREWVWMMLYTLGNHLYSSLLFYVVKMWDNRLIKGMVFVVSGSSKSVPSNVFCMICLRKRKRKGLTYLGLNK